MIIKALRDKRAEIHGQIAAYEARIAQAKHDLAHVNATLRLFTDVEKQRARYVVSHGFFRKGEIADLCAQHLAGGVELTTRELAERVMCARDLDASDATLRRSVVFKVVQALRLRHNPGLLDRHAPLTNGASVAHHWGAAYRPAISVLNALMPEKDNPFVIVGARGGPHLTNLDRP